MWFCTFGGIGLRQARQAEELVVIGEKYFNNSAEFLSEGSTYCYDVPQEDIIFPGAAEDGSDIDVFIQTLPGITPVCLFNSTESSQAWYNVMYSFSFENDGVQHFGSFMAILSIISVIVYFVTSSDSGSLIVDHLASNGHHKHHWFQRLFWAFTEGAVATALLVSGGSNSLSALQAASVVSGLPFTMFVFIMCYSIVKLCELSEKITESGATPTSQHARDDVTKKDWKMPVYGGILNIFELIFSFGNVHQDRIDRGMGAPTNVQIVEFWKALFLPFLAFRTVLFQTHPKPKDAMGNNLATGVYALVFIGMIGFWAGRATSLAFVGVGWAAFFFNACFLCTLRGAVRGQNNIDGNIFFDFLASSFMYPQVLVQMMVEHEEGGNNPDPNEAVIAKNDSQGVEYEA